MTKPSVIVVPGSVEERSLRDKYGDNIDIQYGSSNQYVGKDRYETAKMYDDAISKSGIAPISNIDLGTYTGTKIQDGAGIGLNTDQQRAILDSQKQAYLNQFKQTLMPRDQFIGSRVDQANSQASLQYDQQVARLKKLAAETKAKLDQQKTTTLPEFDKMNETATQGAYNQKQDVSMLLAKMGMLNTGSGVANTQMVNKQLNDTRADISQSKTNFISDIETGKTTADTNLLTDIESIEQLKKAYIAQAMSKAEQDYESYVSSQMGNAENAFWNSQNYVADMDYKDSQLDLQRDELAQRGQEFQEEMKYKYEALQEELSLKRQELAMKADEIAKKYSDQSGEYMNEFGQVISGMTQDEIEWLTKETARVQDNVLRSIVSKQFDVIPAVIYGSVLPEDHKEAQLNLIGEALGWGTLGMPENIRMMDDNPILNLAKNAKASGANYKVVQPTQYYGE